MSDHYDLRFTIAHAAEREAAVLLAAHGYTVFKAGHQNPADLLVNDVLRVDVKAARWTQAKHSPGRYQFNTRNECDLYILRPVYDEPIHFIIPSTIVGNRRNVTIWSKDPTAYKGQWAEYLDAWHIIGQEIARCQNRTSTVARVSSS